MSLEKSEVRIGVANEIGCAMDDALEAARGQVKYCEGGNAFLLTAQKKVQALAKLVDDDLDGKGEGLIKDPETAGLVKKYITRAVAIVGSEAATAGNAKLVAMGHVQAYETAVKGIKKKVDLENAKVAQAKKNEEKALRGGAFDGARLVGSHRLVGEHPGPGIKAQRQAEEAAEKAKPKKTTKKVAKKRAPRKKKADAPNA